MRKFGKVVEGLRRSNGWRQGELADRLGVTQSMISKVERSALCPKVDDLPAWADALGVPTDVLMGLIASEQGSAGATEAA